MLLRQIFLAPLSLAASIFTLPAFASDGVLEISQTCAVNTGCFPGDTPGFPVTLTTAAPARSVRLTSDLTVATGQQTVLNVSVDAATVDLGGFRIVGPAVCSEVPVTSCTNTGVGVGVLGTSDVVVKNGVITGMGNDAVRLTYSSRVEGLNVFHNGGGIVLTDNGIARGSIATSNGGDGIRCRDHCVVAGNTAIGNFGDGLDVGASGTVTGNTANLNGGRGGGFGTTTAFDGNVFSGNSGVDVVGGHASAGNSCEDRSCSARGVRRYYLTFTDHNGAQARTACVAGYHFASLWELFDVGNLEWDTTRGMVNSDSGSSAPSGVTGWVRTGTIGTTSGSAGVANCNVWTSSSGNGTTVALDSGWQDVSAQ